MSIVDLHPEELLEKDARGELTPSESVRLDAHLSKCSVCRFEQTVRADFAEELETEERISKVPLLVAGAMRDTNETPRAPVLAPTLTPGSPASLVPRPLRRPGRRLIAILAAAAVMVAGVAGASGWAGHVFRDTSEKNAPTIAPTGKAAAKATAPRRALPVLHGPSNLVEAPMPSLASPASPPEPVIAPMALVPAPVGPSTSATLPAVPSLVSPAPSPARVSPFGPSTPTAVNDRPFVFVAPEGDRPEGPRPVADTASIAFDAANTARRQGAHDRATFLYRELQSRYPSSSEARMSHVSLARLQLDRGDTSGALAGFEAYLRTPGGDLREDAIVGRATALERLGRGADEADAWNALLVAYPRSAHASHARSRVERATPR